MIYWLIYGGYIREFIEQVSIILIIFSNIRFKYNLERLIKTKWASKIVYNFSSNINQTRA